MSFPKITVRDAETGAPSTLDLHNNTITMTAQDGRLVTMDLGQSDVHIDAALANYAAGYKLAPGIADEVCPVIPVDKASNKYFTWDKDDVFQDAEDLIVGPGAVVKEISPRLSSATYTTTSYGIGSFVPTEVAANADAPLAPEMAAIRRCLNAVMLGRERRVASLLTTSGNWSGGSVTVLGGTAKWNAGSASDPVRDLYTAIEASLTPVRAIAMSERTWHDFVQNAAVQKYVAAKTMVQPIASNGEASNFSALLGLPPILIGTMKGKASSGYGYVWGNNVALLCNDPSAPKDGQTIATAYTFRWTGAGSSDGNMMGGFLVRSYYDPSRGALGGKKIVVVHNDAEVMTSVYAGALITGAHQ